MKCSSYIETKGRKLNTEKCHAALEHETFSVSCAAFVTRQKSPTYLNQSFHISIPQYKFLIGIITRTQN